MFAVKFFSPSLNKILIIPLLEDSPLIIFVLIQEGEL